VQLRGMQPKPQSNQDPPHQDRLELALRLISEQTTVAIDQLAGLLKAPAQETEAIVRSLEGSGCCESRSFLPLEARWLWLTAKGLDRCGSGRSPAAPPSERKVLRLWRARDNVRLYLERRYPKGVWSSGVTGSDQRPGRDLPVADAVLEEGGARYAIVMAPEVADITAHRRFAEELCDEYDIVVCFCAEDVARRLSATSAPVDPSKLVTRRFPADLQSEPALRKDFIRGASEEEITAMTLIAEQGMIREDQLSHFLGTGHFEVNAFVDDLVEANLAERKKFYPGEYDWVYLTHVGANQLPLAGLEFFTVNRGGVARRFVFNELRLYVEACSRDAEWISGRVLLRIHGKAKMEPFGAEVRLKGLRFAINYRRVAVNARSVVPRTTEQDKRYDAVLFFCATPEAERHIQGLREEHRWEKVAIRPLPRSPRPLPEAEQERLSARRSADKLVGLLLGEHPGE
jgi:hypothetical protein